MLIKIKQAGFLVVLVCLSWIFTLQATGAIADSPDSRSQAENSGPTDPAEVKRFMDSFWRENMQPLEIPGAVFVLVQDGQILFSKGYGLADLELGQAVDPTETLFAIGSVSKAVTASAVMQLVEGGQLRLEEPVNSYLKSFQIEKECGEPVTTAHLLTHTAGFDERVIGGSVVTPNQLDPLAEYEARNLPPCIRPPGLEMSYCNHCYGLAGLLVQEVAGVPFEAYVEENIYRPLDMENSSFRQPLPAELDGRRATGYIYSPGLQPAPRIYLNPFPSGGMWASGEDMGQFMIAQLNGGLAGGEQVFSEDIRLKMHQRQFSQDPQLEGWTYGFFEHLENGQRLIEKGGDVPGFSSVLYLMPDHNLGLFLSYNATVATGVSDPRQIFPSYFLDHFFPASETSPAAKPAGNADRLAGTYRWARFGHTSIDKAISPMSILQWQASANADGSLTLTYPAMLGGERSQWIEVEPELFQNPENGRYLAFAQDSRGRVNHIYTKISEEGVLERVAWYETLAFQAGLLIFLIAIFISALVVSLVVLVRRGQAERGARTQAGADEPARAANQNFINRMERLAPWLAAILCSLNLLFLVGLVMVVAQSLATRAPVLPVYFAGMLVIPLVTGALALALLAIMLLAWKDRSGSLAGRIYLSLVTLAGLAFTWFAWYWNLLGFKL